MATTKKTQKTNTVHGKVIDGNARPIEYLKVELYDIDMREWQLLGDTTTNKQGEYELKWTQSQLSGRGKKTADLAVKVCTAEKKTELFKSSLEEVRFNAGEREQINIQITVPIPAERIEFDYLKKQVSFLAGKVTIAELREDQEHRDVSFLSKELEVSADKIEHLILAHRLNHLSKVDTAFFYALLRKNTLLHNSIAQNLSARLSIDLSADVQTLLYDAAMVDVKKIETDIADAAQAMLVAPTVVKQAKRNIELLNCYRKEAEAYYQKQHPQKVVELLTSVFQKGNLQQAQQIFRENKNDLNAFFDKLIASPLFEPKGKGEKAKVNLHLNKLLGLGNEIIPQIVSGRKIKKADDIRKLAKLNKAEWVKEIKSANPNSKDDQLISSYASTIVRKFEKEFPTTAFAAQLERAKEPELKNRDAIVSFLDKHADFDLTKTNIDLFLKKKELSNQENKAMNNELKSVQRVFSLIPHYSKTMALRKQKMHSAYAIFSAGETRFVNEIAPKAGLSEIEAKTIYKKAETKHTAAMLMVADMNDSMSVMDVASFETKSLALKLEAVSKDFPNLKSLFKAIDTCECEHCRSVYSPAAYLVEILQFLDKRTVVAGNAKSVLFDRRSDLGEIDLGCANANTPVKYIDLVCELLEDQVAPDEGIDYTGDLADGADPLHGKISSDLLTALQAEGLPVTEDALIHHTETDLPSSANLPHYLRDKKLVCKIVNVGVNTYKIFRLRQTFSSAEELDAAPEYVNEAAYTELRNKSYAFQLPFDLHHTEAKSYFNRFDINRADLMQTFQMASNPSDEAIAADRLGLSEEERAIIVDTPSPNDNAAQQELWNVPAPGDVVDHLKQVDHFLDKTKLSYRQLNKLLQFEFIDPDNELFIQHDDLTCDTATKQIANLDRDALDRMHRFLRLLKKINWEMEVLGSIISQTNLGGGTLDDNCLKKIALIKQISDMSGIKIAELIGCFGMIPHKIYDEEDRKPLYYQVFLNKAKNGTIDDALLPENMDGTQLVSAFTKSIATCLQLKEKDLISLLPLLPDDVLGFSNLSYLYALSRLIKKLKIKASEITIVTELTGIDISSSPSAMFDFIQYVQQFSKSPLKAVDIRFILNHEADNLVDRIISDLKIEETLNKLKAAYLKINTDLQSKFNPDLSAEEQQEALLNVLSGLQNVSADDAKAIVDFLAKEWTSAASAKAFIDGKFDSKIDRTAINTAIDALDAVASGNDTSAEQLDLVEALLNAVALFQIESAKYTALVQLLAATFKIEEATAVAVLTNSKLKQIAPGTALLADLLSDNLINAITTVSYPNQYAALRLLHKMMLLIKSLELNDLDCAWYLKNNAALGWLELDGIPFEAGQTAIDLSVYLDFLQTIQYTKDYPPTINPADAEQPVSFFSLMDSSFNASITQDEFCQLLAILTGYEKDDLIDIDDYLFAAFDPTNYQIIDNFKHILGCAEYMHKLGASLTQVISYIKPSLLLADVNDLRATLKSRYDEDTWLSTLKEIMDAIRPKKRDALVAYLLATNPDIKDENDLFEYLLVDVEMESCMPSSRIVLAHNTVQLFVQRCLMGLEPDAIADVDTDPNWNQWKWMKNYRVWEANRKVFLYPENWYDVTLADDKSFLLTEFINELQQNELTNDTAEDALRKYLEKLDNIAFLEVMATWYDVPTKNMHVFARTKGGDPAIYYYRRFEKERYWTAWEKVELDISGDHLLAFIRNNRLQLAWPVFSEETDPGMEATVPDQTPGTTVKVEGPKRKLKIQLATSEYSNKKWQPKRLSREAIKTPPGVDDYTHDLIPKENFKFFYNQWFDQIICFNEQSIWVQQGEFDGEYQNQTILAGAFDLAGCKGYPELAPSKPFQLDFIPKFKDTNLLEQRYKEMDLVAGDDLAAVNVHSLLSGMDFVTLLNQTPGRFRLSYPHQFTWIDGIVLGYELLIYMLLSGSDNRKRFQPKFPLGTMLPYFKENSRHAYVIIPGFYRKTESPAGMLDISQFNDSEKRTASDVFKLIEDILNWIKKIIHDFQTNPPADAQAAVDMIVTDPGLHDILKEISKYEALDFILNFMIGKTGAAEFDTLLQELVESEGLVYGEQFKNMYHPLICHLRTILYRDGVPGLMKRETQLQKTGFDFKAHYVPNGAFIPQGLYKQPDGTLIPSFPIEDVDFTSDGSYSLYNWDLFFRVPLHIAGSLTRNQRFEEALTWFHYMFNPTGALPGNGVQKYWVTKPFYLNQDADYIAQRIDTLMYGISDASNPAIKELEFAISEWRTKPFRPDVIARFRPVAYQKALLMKYIDNLTEWGDYLFRQDTMESIAQATQMYILADKLLGPKPRIVPAVVKAPYETYNQIEAKLDSFGNALIELENILPDLTVLPEEGTELPPSPITLSTLYFCIPHNEKMNEYWDRVADRLFKIRHCQNIDGVERSLALFAPPIDPGMLVRAAASGLDISSVLAGLNAPTPYYRFNVLAQKATELSQEVRGLGSSLLQTLEKKDAEALTLLRNELELKVLFAVRDIKKLQIKESGEQIEILKRTKKVTEERRKYYAKIEKITKKEQLNLDKLGEANEYQIESQVVRTVAGALRLIPEFHVGGAGFGGSPKVVMQLGGSAISGATSIAADILNILGTVASYDASRAATLGGYDRRFDDWKLQESLATKELASIEKQITAAEIRKEIAETDLRNHDLQIDNLKKTDEFMRSKFTNKELYDWMIGQISAVYFKSYQLAHDFAKKAERSYRFELGNDDSFISFGYWDSMKKGLQSADHLIHDIKRMETGYLDKNKREYEITKHVSLAQLDPLALVRLRAAGVTDFELPEAIFDTDHPGQYFRRVKSVSISIPCIAGPYTSVSAKLSLVKNKYRKATTSDNAAGTGYAEDPGNDERFVYNIGAIQSIATSSAQNDSGMFELNFKDERYLPFEGTGAISSWRLELPTEVRQLDYNTIADVIIHVKYTAREGGSSLKTLANTALKEQFEIIRQSLSQEGLHVAINMKNEMPNEWHLLKQNGTINLTIDKSRLPYMVQPFDTEIVSLMLVAKVKDNPASFTITIDGNATNLSRVTDLMLCTGINFDVELGTAFDLGVAAADRVKLEELMLVVKYSF